MHLNDKQLPVASPDAAFPASKSAQLELARSLMFRSSYLGRKKDGTKVTLDGYSLTVADVVSVARAAIPVALPSDSKIVSRIDESVKFLESKLHTSVYGVTTGFGGSADTRTPDLLALQLGLLEHQLCGVLPIGLDLHAHLPFMMPEHIVRGAMLIRINSLARGHSAVRYVVLETLVTFLNRNLIPVVPLRGSISASGDLSPLSYIAAAICGHPDIKVIDRSSEKVQMMYAPDVLAKHGISPVVLGPKEGLGLINGTAVSASAATLALHDSHFLALLSQALTALTVEAMLGMKGSFDPFIHDVTRPHLGQSECAKNIRSMLAESKLAVEDDGDVNPEFDAGILRQDRYPLRTSAQWIGPQLESLGLAQQQVDIELNSTTDNPLLDVTSGIIHHGGNFQAMAVTQAMESTRLTLEHFGKLSFQQLTELVNCTMNRGLPSCLAGSEPSTNYFAKGLDIHAAAYCAELGFLASPVSTHVQSAEMNNQAVNSMALVSARKTIEANDVLTLLMSSHLLVCCQAIDLRVADVLFRSSLGKLITYLTQTHLANVMTKDETAIESLNANVREQVFRRLDQTGSMDSSARFQDVASFASSVVFDSLIPSAEAFIALRNWKFELARGAVQLFSDCQTDVFQGRVDVTSYLGQTRHLYHFVRRTLRVNLRRGDVYDGKAGYTIGRSVAAIVEGLKSKIGRKATVNAMKECSKSSKSPSKKREVEGGEPSAKRSKVAVNSA